MSVRNPHKASNVNDKDERQHRFTPRKLIADLHAEFRFTMDACGHPLSPASQIIGRGYTLAQPSRPLMLGNCYHYRWTEDRVWLQPDFNKIPEAIKYAHTAVTSGGCPLVVLLMPWNRQEQPVWHTWIEPYRDGKGRLIDMLDREVATIETRAIKGRVKFGTPDDPEGVKKHPKLDDRGQPVWDLTHNRPVMLPNAPGFGCGLVIWRRN